MVDNRLLLVKAITLLYRESLLTEQDSNSADLVRTVLEGIKLPELALAMNSERELLSGLKDTALWMCAQPVDHLHEKEDLLQRLKVNCKDDERLYEAFAQGIDKEMDDPSVKRTVLAIRQFINDSFRENEIVNMLQKAANDTRFNRDKIKDIRQYASELTTKLEPYLIASSRKDPAIVSSIDIGDDSSMMDIFNSIESEADSTSLLKSGWQGLNRMLQGGFRRGESWVISALQHNYKTGFSLSLFKHLAIYNKPVLTNPAKKPLLLRISFEDDLKLNMQFLYQSFYENEHGKPPEMKGLDPKVMKEYVQAKMQASGYHVKMMRVNPSDWTFKDIQNTVLHLEAEGYEVHCLMLDYLPMIPTTGCEQGPAGHDYRDMVRRMRNFCSAKGILMITPWQMSTDAKMQIREGRTEFVKFVAGKGFYSGSKQIDQEVDGELHIHIEKLNGAAYLTIQRGKHRIPTIIPDLDKYMVLAFPEVGSIPDDYGKRELTLKKVGGGPIGSGQETPFFEFEV